MKSCMYTAFGVIECPLQTYTSTSPPYVYPESKGDVVENFQEYSRSYDSQNQGSWQNIIKAYDAVNSSNGNFSLKYMPQDGNLVLFGKNANGTWGYIWDIVPAANRSKFPAGVWLDSGTGSLNFVDGNLSTYYTTKSDVYGCNKNNNNSSYCAYNGYRLVLFDNARLSVMDKYSGREAVRLYNGI